MIAAEAFCTKTVTRALCAVLVCLALGITRGHTAAAAEDAIPPLATTPMNQIVGRQVLPWLDAIFEKLLAEKTDIVIDGTKAFTDRDLFLLASHRATW
jgi:hypothetical protein